MLADPGAAWNEDTFRKEMLEMRRDAFRRLRVNGKSRKHRLLV